MKLSYLLGAIAAGFLCMSLVGMQALVALFSSIPLAKRRHRENPAFDLRRAYRRILLVTVLAVVLTVLAAILAAVLLPLPAVAGYLLGMILGFVCSLRRLSPNNERNQRIFARFYEDCLTEESDIDDTRIS